MHDPTLGATPVHMDIFDLLPPLTLALALSIGALSGLIKGVVGFAMPMVMVSGLSTIMAPELALAGLIIPTLVTNGLQALRNGWRAARDSVTAFRIFLGVGLVCLLVGAQLVRNLPAHVMLLALGVLVSGFAMLQLFGWQPRLERRSTKIEIIAGASAGLAGGFSGVWGPPTVAYLSALNTPKADQMRIQGVVYGLGAVALMGAHIGSGVFNTQTAPFSALLLGPALLGMWIGTRIQDRINQATFRKATLAVLLLAGLNLVRRGLMG